LANKYNARQIVIGDEVFDSKKEGKRWMILKQYEKEGKIFNLQRQVKFVLIPSQREPDKVGARGGVIKGKVIEKECSYIADFMYGTEQGIVVEDVKGYKRGGAYAVFSIKRKLMLKEYGLRVKEI
jgi:hypothetical protein